MHYWHYLIKESRQRNIILAVLDAIKQKSSKLSSKLFFSRLLRRLKTLSEVVLAQRFHRDSAKNRCL